MVEYYTCKLVEPRLRVGRVERSRRFGFDTPGGLLLVVVRLQDDTVRRRTAPTCMSLEP